MVKDSHIKIYIFIALGFVSLSIMLGQFIIILSFLQIFIKKFNPFIQFLSYFIAFTLSLSFSFIVYQHIVKFIRQKYSIYFKVEKN